jgi:hypothetical protein
MQALLTIDSTAPDIRLPGLPLLRRLLGSNPDFGLHDVAAPDRAAAENYVADCFAKAYGAQVTEFAPYLLTVSCAGKISGVAGIRPADAPLFSERYLDAPVESVLGEMYGRVVSRREVFELSNLAALRPGVCQLMYMVMAPFLYRAGFRYVVFAGTTQVERTVRKMSFALRSIAPADPARLGDSAALWGSYYETCPKVMAIDLDESMRVLGDLPLQSTLFDIYAERTEALANQFVSLAGNPGARSYLPSVQQAAGVSGG